MWELGRECDNEGSRLSMRKGVWVSVRDGVSVRRYESKPGRSESECKWVWEWERKNECERMGVRGEWGREWVSLRVSVSMFNGGNFSVSVGENFREWVRGSMRVSVRVCVKMCETEREWMTVREWVRVNVRECMSEWVWEWVWVS